MPDDEINWYSEENATLGDRLATAREAAGLTQAQLAKQLGVKTSVLDGWENDRKEPRANRLQMLTGLLGVSLRWLLTGEGDGPDNEAEDLAVSADLEALLAEIRSVRTTVAAAGVRLGQLEKRLRTAIRDQ
ncbi:helix-turn-helix domain-containing protein [Yoonia sp. 208BN28-4]|uniref:helix-turn-helix domain-containing protein n=1 Tax=Yoonia sp. 208BN28-4 TaxID=3126505 RepID=UPI0030A381E0